MSPEPREKCQKNGKMLPKTGNKKALKYNVFKAFCFVPVRVVVPTEGNKILVFMRVSEGLSVNRTSENSVFLNIMPKFYADFRGIREVKKPHYWSEWCSLGKTLGYRLPVDVEANYYQQLDEQFVNVP